MVAGEPEDFGDSSFSSNLFSLVETQTMEIYFQLEVKTSIRGVNVKLKIKGTLYRIGERFKAICTQWKVVGKIYQQVLEMISKNTGSSGSGGKQAYLSSMWVTKSGGDRGK